MPASAADAFGAMFFMWKFYGEPGDGKIFISTLDDIRRIRTGETGSAAV
jgi:nitrogen regulatory protein PII